MKHSSQRSSRHRWFSHGFKYKPQFWMHLRSLRSQLQPQFWLQTIPGRLLIMFAVGLLIVQSLTGFLYWRDRQLNTSPARIQAFGDRIVAIANVFTTTPSDQ
ncbi:MAG: hypothetical protein F6K09_27115, partial [Merismopedia sp. SIO2A8]|nr:hypothetical protein [Merismopedia sp. SIO2A8]